MSITITDKILLARLCYSIGVDYIENSYYDELVFGKMLPHNPYRLFNTEELSQNTIERLILLAETEGLSISKEYEEFVSSKAKEILDSYRSDFDRSKLRTLFPQAMSMQMANEISVVTDDYLWQIANICQQDNQSNEITLHYSYKMDGWNIAVYYDKSIADTRVTNEDNIVFIKPCYAHSRGSDGATFTDCTELMVSLLPMIKEDNLGNNVFQITGELTMFKECLPKLNTILGKDYSNVRNTISGFVKGTIPLEYNYMVRYNAFKIRLSDSSSLCDTAEETYIWLHNNGFYVPAGNITTSIKGTTVEETHKNIVDTFTVNFKAFEKYYLEEVSKIFECDGLTMQPNRFRLSEDMKPVSVGNFGYGLLAIKAGIWYKKTYQSKILHIHFAKSRTNRVPIAIVEPVATNLGQKIRTVPLLHPQTIIDNDIRKDDEIEFTYHSQQIVEFSKNLSAIERSRQRGVGSTK